MHYPSSRQAHNRTSLSHTTSQWKAPESEDSGVGASRSTTHPTRAFQNQCCHRWKIWVIVENCEEDNIWSFSDLHLWLRVYNISINSKGFEVETLWEQAVYMNQNITLQYFKETLVFCHQKWNLQVVNARWVPTVLTFRNFRHLLPVLWCPSGATHRMLSWNSHISPVFPNAVYELFNINV